jgi:hypothetical protein
LRTRRFSAVSKRPACHAADNASRNELRESTAIRTATAWRRLICSTTEQWVGTSFMT